MLQLAVLAPIPELPQHELQERETPGLVARVVENAIYHAGREAEPHLLCRLLDRSPQLLPHHRPDVDLRSLELVGEWAVREGMADEVAAQRQGHGQRAC